MRSKRKKAKTVTFNAKEISYNTRKSSRNNFTKRTIQNGSELKKDIKTGNRTTKINKRTKPKKESNTTKTDLVFSQHGKNSFDIKLTAELETKILSNGKIVIHPNKLNHYDEIFQNSDRTQCPICKVQIAVPSRWKRHLESHSAAKKGVPCPICKKIFTRLDHMRAHEKRHLQIFRAPQRTETKSVELPLNAFGKGNDVTLSKQYLLEECFVVSGKVVTKPKTFGQGRVSSKPKSPKKTFVCSSSGKVVMQSEKLKKYNEKSNKMTDNNKKEFSCRICKKVFSRADNMKAHEKRHLGVFQVMLKDNDGDNGKRKRTKRRKIMTVDNEEEVIEFDDEIEIKDEVDLVQVLEDPLRNCCSVEEAQGSSISPEIAKKSLHEEGSEHFEDLMEEKVDDVPQNMERSVNFKRKDVLEKNEKKSSVVEGNDLMKENVEGIPHDKENSQSVLEENMEKSSLLQENYLMKESTGDSPQDIKKFVHLEVKDLELEENMKKSSFFEENAVKKESKQDIARDMERFVHLGTKDLELEETMKKSSFFEENGVKKESKQGSPHDMEGSVHLQTKDLELEENMKKSSVLQENDSMNDNIEDIPHNMEKSIHLTLKENLMKENTRTCISNDTTKELLCFKDGSVHVSPSENKYMDESFNIEQTESEK